ncbi:MBL fold metallo-hydrolase [Deinococcus taeanensis]|uniref:MBL fold metallo-hydrolase n=1 Tax=Deinococcus taeanensis TaxID=2737050 RepID=UPI001CDBB5DA|nr:MBL fold metallo-hydrolase [Deinococcus taeanensis]UBV43671.1 MBL fold metallo-hydrolase [Deinococcus taeanensis]
MSRPPLRLTQLGLINTYLVLEDDGLTLIDAGLPGLERRVLRAARQLHRPLRRLVLTHAHDDHTGAVDALAALVPGLEFLLGEADAPLLKACGVRTPPTRLLRSGDRVESLTVIDTPGHSPGHVAYLDGRDGTLFAGDTFVNVPGLRVASVLHPLFPLPTFGTHDAARTIRSARTLLDVPARLLALGHGPVLPRPQAAMERAVQAAEADRGPSPLRVRLAKLNAHLTRLSTAGAVRAKARITVPPPV